MMTMTAGIARAALESPTFADEIARAGIRYYRHDWGELCDEDKALNDEALKGEGRILAAYNTTRGKVWIITEANHGGDLASAHATTTILFASEY